ncbi:MAG TPA: hypothetical protein VKB38_10930 [Terracidiphilus sp.]|nr:hypothetical protein [Terracidiphilus sp.]
MDGQPYSRSVPGNQLRQGEIISSVAQYMVSVNYNDQAQPSDVRSRIHPYVIVLSQDCDLAQDFSCRQSSNTSNALQNILLCEVDLASNIKGDRTRIPGSDIWKRIHQNQDSRFQFLRAVVAEHDTGGAGIPEMLVDFRRAFTLPTADLYEQAKWSAKRRAVLKSPYVEHLSTRFGFFLSRVALPLDHHVEIREALRPKENSSSEDVSRT